MYFYIQIKCDSIVNQVYAMNIANDNPAFSSEEEDDDREFLSREEAVEAYKAAWLNADTPEMNLYRKYGKGTIDYIEGYKDQPNWSFSFQLTYGETDGLLRFSWQRESEDALMSGIKATMNPDYELKVYNGYTLLQLELPQQKTRLKISSKGFLHFLSALNPGKVQTGSANFDQTFITIARPKNIIHQLHHELDFLLDDDFGKSLSLITDFEDAITNRFYLQLRINQLLTTEATIEKLLKHTLALVNKLNTLG